MNDVQTDKTHISYEVQRQFLRRTPVKLKQFSRLLSDMLVQEVDKLRVKALLSQVRKTREACLAQQFDSTARLLNQLSKQLSMSSESIKSQRPLLKRLASRLLDHSKQLELGVKPQRQSTLEAIPEPKPVEDTHDSTENEIEEFKTEAPVSFENYVEKGKLIFVEDPNEDQKLSQIRSDYTLLHQQFTSMGVDSLVVDSMQNARAKAEEQRGSVIIANLDLVEEAEVLPDEEIEKNLTPVIYISSEDSQKNRARSIRNGGQGFLVDPVSISTLCGQIEHLYDLNADSPKRILVMEDSKAQARYYEKVLSKGHFETRIVTDPSKLLETLREFEPESVLMDMQMPDSSGIELTQMIRQMPRYLHLPIIFLSAEENLRKQNQALKSGGTAFIVKPVQKDQLMFMADLYSERYRELSPKIEINPD
ncbi:MAG: response regulator, partial [Kangiellaceae bacterium]|nr:response regulator [Kangiellaceae bacterium]